jgi:hypothetical protein
MNKFDQIYNDRISSINENIVTEQNADIETLISLFQTLPPAERELAIQSIMSSNEAPNNNITPNTPSQFNQQITPNNINNTEDPDNLDDSDDSDDEESQPLIKPAQNFMDKAKKDQQSGYAMG